MPDDIGAIEGWQRGEDEAVRAVFALYYPRAVRLAALSGLSFEQAQDCAQDAFVQAFERRRQLRDPQAFPLWFHRIVTRHILDTMRAAARRESRERADPLEDADTVSEDWQRRRVPRPEEVALLAEQREALWRQIQLLAPRYRIPLVLRYYGDFSVREVAEMMGEREGTMRVTLHRALNQLRQAGGIVAARERSPTFG